MIGRCAWDGCVAAAARARQRATAGLLVAAGRRHWGTVKAAKVGGGRWV